MNTIRLWLAQMNPLVGDIAGNVQKMTAQRAAARAAEAHLVLFPELALTGYPPEDLLFHQGFRSQVEAATQELLQSSRDGDVLVGYPEYTAEGIYNSALWANAEGMAGNHRKCALPNYQVFDEKRYFKAGDKPTVISRHGIRFGVLICEDIWQTSPAQAAKSAGAEVLLVLNASPFDVTKPTQREAVVRERVNDVNLPVVYVNLVGGQDELVFDGGSFVMNAQGEITTRLKSFEEDSAIVCFERRNNRVEPVRGSIAATLSKVQAVYRALVLGVHDYVHKHRFKGVVLGLSGGVDSALTLSIAVDALGASNVQAVMMPSRYTAQMSIDDAKQQAETLGVKFSVLSIEPMFETALQTLKDTFVNQPVDVTEENIQSRCRGVLLMAISNKSGAMVLTTGNKSEMAVGYATLYGDMAGGFAPIKDCSKLMVYELAHYRNQSGMVIPTRVLERAPSAELREDQKDSDSLPPYEILDPILEAFIERDMAVEQICALGFDAATVVRVLTLVKRNEYKRRQAPPGIRISSRAFGRDWRYPITSGYRLNVGPSLTTNG